MCQKRQSRFSEGTMNFAVYVSTYNNTKIYITKLIFNIIYIYYNVIYLYILMNSARTPHTMLWCLFLHRLLSLVGLPPYVKPPHHPQSIYFAF